MSEGAVSEGAVSEGAVSEAPGWLRELPARVARLDPAFFRDFAPPVGAARHSAVLMLFGPHPGGGTDVLLTERGSQLRAHAGQVSFPGGRVDPQDAGAIAAALREAEEEVGVDPTGVEVIATLPSLYLSPSDNVVTPVAAWWHTPTEVSVVSPIEVERVVRISVADLVDPGNRFFVDTPIGYSSPGFEVEGLFVWGFTAKLLAVTLELAGLSGPWDEAARRPLPLAQWRR